MYYKKLDYYYKMWYTISSYKGVIDMSNDVVNEMNNTLIKQINEIKKDIVSTRNRVLLDANKELLYLYFRIGKIISENQKYGTNFINTLSTSLKLEFNDASGFSPRNLARMRKFYETYKDLKNLPPAVAKLPWTHIETSKMIQGIVSFFYFWPK